MAGRVEIMPGLKSRPNAFLIFHPSFHSPHHSNTPHLKDERTVAELESMTAIQCGEVIARFSYHTFVLGAAHQDPKNIPYTVHALVITHTQIHRVVAPPIDPFRKLVTIGTAKASAAMQAEPPKHVYLTAYTRSAEPAQHEISPGECRSLPSARQ